MSTRHSVVRIVIAVMYGLFSGQAALQAAAVPLGTSRDPAVLSALQVCIALTGAAATWSIARDRRWAPSAAVTCGVATAVMLTALPFILGLPVEARAGIWAGAGTVLLLAVATAWYLRRRPPTETDHAQT